MKFTRINSHVRKTTIDGKDYYIGKDCGTFRNNYYYYIEVDGKVIYHGLLTLKSAKNILKNLTNKEEIAMAKITKERKREALNPNYKLTKIYSVDDIKRMHKGYFFTPDTMRFFKSRLIQEVFPTNKKAVYFVTSEKKGFTDETRVFNVRRYNIEADIFDTMETFDTRIRALSHALDLAYNETIGE